MNFLKQFFLILIEVILFTSYSNAIMAIPSEKVIYEAYSYNENFEIGEINPLKYWVSNLKKKEDCNVSYSYDMKSKTEGNSSLIINIDSKGLKDASKQWYYYLKIPLNPTPNLESNLSFSIDVKMDQQSATNIQIGFNLRYLPLSSGIYSFDKMDYKQFNKWTTIKNNDLKSLFTNNHANRFISEIYEAKLSDFGRIVSNIVILIKGRGAQKYQISLDNLKVSGRIMTSRLFYKQSKNRTSEYVKKIEKEVKRREKLYEIQLKKSKKKSFSKNREDYKNRIELLLKEINNTIKKNKVLKSSKVELLDFYLRRLKSLNNDSLEMNVYKMPTMKYHRLTGYNTPILDKVTSFNLRMTPGEYKSIALLVEAGKSPGVYSIENSKFLGENGSFSKNNIDIYIAKIWYQSGRYTTLKMGKFLTQELLLKNEKMVKVDYKTKTNYLQVKFNDTNLTKYIKISNPLDKFPRTETITFNDSKSLQPFELDFMRHKLIWGIIHIPTETKEGSYTSLFKIKNKKGIIVKEFPININVLPFELDKSKLIYSLYYKGKLIKGKVPSIESSKKTKRQQEIELIDMKDHGVLYPTSYETLETLEETLNIRNKIGLPNDKFYTIGFNVMSHNLSQKILEYKKILQKNGYDENSLYIYAIDEASKEKLKEEVLKIQTVHKYGAKVFVAGYGYTHRYLGKYLDLFNYAHGVVKDDAKQQVSKWHSSKKEIFAYASPQSGVENPEIYRRNFGCRLWKKNFDGAMNWAYQANRGAFWNDFDDYSEYKSPYREEVFTYPTTDGIVGTIQWEGFREAVTDTRYIATLGNLRDKLKKLGVDVSNLTVWLRNIDCNSDLDSLRENLTNKILFYRKQYLEKVK